MNSENTKYQDARKKVKDLKGFYIHLTTFVLVNTLLFLINMTTSPDYLWFYWPMAGWGIGLLMNAIYVLGFGQWFGAEWEERKIQEIADRS